jgi:hypothetical protein
MNIFLTGETEVQKHYDGTGYARCNGVVIEAGRKPHKWSETVKLTKKTMQSEDWEKKAVKSAQAKFRKEIKKTYFLNRYVWVDCPDGRRKMKAEDTIGLIEAGMQLMCMIYSPNNDGMIGKLGRVEYSTLDGVMYVAMLIDDGNTDIYQRYITDGFTTIIVNADEHPELKG